MPHDPELAAETRGWLVKAKHDLQAADALLKTEPPLLDETVFLCQQAVEKCFKGFLTWHSTPFRKTHLLEEIGSQCLNIEPALLPLVDKAVPLTKYAWKYRYPGEPEQPSPQETAAALKVAKMVYADIVRRLPKEAGP